MKRFKKCKSYREFHKILRKYTMKRYRKYRSIEFNDLSGPWVSFVIKTDDDIKSLKNTKLYNKSTILPSMINSFIKDRGKKCLFDKIDKGTLIGIELTNEDYYYVYELEDGNVSCQSCVGNYEVIK